MASASPYAFAAPSKSPLRLEQFANPRQRAGIRRIEIDSRTKVRERGRRVASLPLDAGKLPVQKGAVRRARDRRRVRADRIVDPAGAGGRPRIGQPLPGDAEPQHLDAPPDLRQRGIDRDGGFECGERLGLIVERQVRFTAADQRRGLRGLTGERPIEMLQRGLRIAIGELDVAESDLGRIERRRRLERRRELALGVPQIAGLKKRPRANVLRRRPACRRQCRGNDRRDEIRESRRRDDRQRHNSSARTRP